jgi:ATP-dependent Lon protease
MKESAAGGVEPRQIARADWKCDSTVFEKSDIHVHVPSGRDPERRAKRRSDDVRGARLAPDRTNVRSNVAMTGEISLRGIVLPVGGIKEKVLAALSAGIDTVLLPEKNRKDFEEIPPSMRSRLQFVWLEKVDDAIAAALQMATETRRHAPAYEFRRRKQTPRAPGRPRPERDLEPP